MKYERRVTLADGAVLELRSLRIDDAAQALAVFRQMAGETQYLMRYPDEVTMSVQQEAELIRRYECAPDGLMLGAFVHGKLACVANFTRVGSTDRTRHRASVGIAVLKAYWHRGIASAVMQALIDTAKRTELEQLELDVMHDNERAKALYERYGFEEYGRHVRAIKYRDGRYADLILMARRL